MNHNSYTDYLKEIIDMVPEDVDVAFKDILQETLRPTVKKRWKDYQIGKSQSYLLSEEELEASWQKASITSTENSLRNLSELGLIKLSINEEGEIVYSITKEGLEYVKNLK